MAEFENEGRVSSATAAKPALLTTPNISCVSASSAIPTRSPETGCSTFLRGQCEITALGRNGQLGSWGRHARTFWLSPTVGPG